MKTIILAGGWGTRMGHLTELIPKPMVSIGNRPIIWHIMQSYSKYGYNDFIIALGVKGDVIKRYFMDFSYLNNDFSIDFDKNKIKIINERKVNWKIKLIDTGLNTLKGARIKMLENYLDEGSNMLTYGDGLSNVNIKDLIKFHKSHGKIITFTGVHPSGRFGEFEENNNIVSSFSEKPQKRRTYINGGFMIFEKKLLDYLTTNENCDLEFGIMELLAKKGQVMVYKHEGFWACMDHERDVKHLNDLWKSKKAFW